MAVGGNSTLDSYDDQSCSEVGGQLLMAGDEMDAARRFKMGGDLAEATVLCPCLIGRETNSKVGIRIGLAGAQEGPVLASGA